MSVTRERRSAAGGYRPRTADQLPRPQQEQERQVGRGLLALLGVLLIVVGVPALLVAFVGNPLPTSVPDRSWLEAEITAEAIINVFAVLVWLLWAHFVVCLVAELRAVRAGRMPGVVPLGGGLQVVARRLVAGVLLLAGAATMTGHAPTSDGPAETTSVTRQADEVASAQAGGLRIEGLTDTGAGVVGAAAGAVDQVTAHATGRAAGEVSDAAVVKYYEVKPPQGRNYDTLWDIADRTLGDPFRYKEIFELNRDRVQPDGRRLVDADLIQPGWQLVMPADATGPDIQSVTRAPRAQTGGTDEVTRSGAAASGASAALGAQGSGSLADAGGSLADGSGSLAGTAGSVAGIGGSLGEGAGMPSAGTGEHGATDLGDLLLGGGLVLAGLLLALTTRRGPYGTPDETDRALRLAGNPGRADLLDRALRVLSEGCRAHGLPLPDAAAVYVNDDQVVLHVAGRPGPPPAPWQQADQGRSWTVRREHLPETAPAAPAPWPALVSIAESHGFDLLVDLEHAPGLVSLGGDAGVAREVALSVAVDLVTHPWSDSVEVTMVGFGSELSEVAPDRVRHVGSIEEAVEQAREAVRGQDALLRSLGVDGVLAGRSAGSAAALRPHVLVLSGPPSPEQAEQLNQLTSHGRSVLTTVCVGATPSARWRFTTEAGGSIDLGALGMAGTARRLTPDALDTVQGLLRAAAEEAGARAAEAAVRAPASVVADLPAPANPSVPAAEATVHVSLLGPVQVSAPGTVTPARQALLTELVALVALQADGVHESVLRVALWPRGVEDDVVHSTLAAAQRWLGSDTSGRPVLDQDAEGRWRLGAGVHVDWHELVAAAHHGEDPDRLVEALSLGRGVAFSAVPPGRYSWLAFHQAARESRVLVTAVARRAAGQLLGRGERGGAEQALRLGLRLVPQAQALWRDLIRLLGDDGPGAVAAAAEQLHEALAGSPYEPETDALLAHLVPQQDKTS